MVDRKRASSVDEYLDISKQLFSRSGTDEKPLSELFTPADDDVIITPFSKSGTTWLQQIFHTLRTRGDMDFDDISEVVPWLEVSPAIGIDLNAPQRATPRGFKSHLPFDKIPKGARYINSIRHPNDVAWSLFKFTEGWFIEPGSVTIDEFVRKLFLANADYYKHLLSWWPHRDDENVLFLAYEHMIADLPGTIERVARFIDVELDVELLELTTQHASLQFMQAHKNRFDDALLRELSERELLPEGSDSAKVREGKIGAHRGEMSDGLLIELDQK